MIHRRRFHVRPSGERRTDGPSKPPSPWTRPPRGPAWSRDSTTAAGTRPHPPWLLPTQDLVLTLPHPSLWRTARQRLGSSTGEWAPPARRLLRQHTGSSTDKRAPPPTRTPPVSGLLHRRLGSTIGSASSWTRRGGSTDSLLHVAI
jgi:hypothetical protein